MQQLRDTSHEDRGDECVESAPTVHLKAELHSSRGDHQHELELFEQADALVLEGPEHDGEFRATEGWFEQALSGLFYILTPVYTSKQELVNLAELTDTPTYYTRDSDAEVLRNAPLALRGFSAGVYFLLLPFSILVGLVTNDYVAGASLLAFSFACPVLLLRWYNMRRSDSEHNRDEIMAERIAKAADQHQTVLAIVGSGHADGVSDALANEIETMVHPTEYGRASREHLTDIAVPLFQSFSLLFTLYLVLLWAIRTVVGLL